MEKKRKNKTKQETQETQKNNRTDQTKQHEAEAAPREISKSVRGKGRRRTEHPEWDKSEAGARPDWEQRGAAALLHQCLLAHCSSPAESHWL